MRPKPLGESSYCAQRRHEALPTQYVGQGGSQVSGFFLALCCLGKIPGGTPFSQLHKSGNGSRVDRP